MRRSRWDSSVLFSVEAKNPRLPQKSGVQRMAHAFALLLMGSMLSSNDAVAVRLQWDTAVRTVQIAKANEFFARPLFHVRTWDNYFDVDWLPLLETVSISRLSTTESTASRLRVSCLLEKMVPPKSVSFHFIPKGSEIQGRAVVGGGPTLFKNL